MNFFEILNFKNYIKKIAKKSHTLFFFKEKFQNVVEIVSSNIRNPLNKNFALLTKIAFLRIFLTGRIALIRTPNNLIPFKCYLKDQENTTKSEPKLAFPALRVSEILST